MITEFCTSVELRLCCQTERIWKLTGGGQCSLIKEVEQKKKGALILLSSLCEKNISAHTVGVTNIESEIDLILART